MLLAALVGVGWFESACCSFLYGSALAAGLPGALVRVMKSISLIFGLLEHAVMMCTRISSSWRRRKPTEGQFESDVHSKARRRVIERVVHSYMYIRWSSRLDVRFPFQRLNFQEHSWLCITAILNFFWGR